MLPRQTVGPVVKLSVTPTLVFYLYLVFCVKFINERVLFSFYSIIKKRIHGIFQVFRVKVFPNVKTLENQKLSSLLVRIDHTLDCEEMLG